MDIFTSLYSYFDKKQDPQVSSHDTDSPLHHSQVLLVISHNDFQKTDCVELASSLTQGGVSPDVLSHVVLRTSLTSLPKTTIKQHLQVGVVRVREEGWLDESVYSSENNKKIKPGMTTVTLSTCQCRICRCLFSKLGYTNSNCLYCGVLTDRGKFIH